MRTSQVSSLLMGAVASIAPFVQSAAAEETCTGCTVRYVVVEMPEQYANVKNNAEMVEAPTSVAVTTSASTTSSRTTIYESQTTTHVDVIATYAPVIPADLDTSNPENVVPKKHVSLSYGSTHHSGLNERGEPNGGAIDMSFEMNSPAVVLDYVESIVSVDCSSDSVTVKFDTHSMYAQSLAAWEQDDEFLIITNNMGDCDVEFERGFFLVESISSEEEDLAITCKASKREIPDLAESMEMGFSSIPASSHQKRIDFNPKFDVSFAHAIDPGLVLFQQAPYLTVRADEAKFQTTVTFSGYLKYSFWRFKVQELYFDLDTDFSADVILSAEIGASFNYGFDYTPPGLSYSLIEVPGIVSIGPGVAFGISVDMYATAAVNLRAGAGIAIPNGNVHLDVLDGSKNGASGWDPVPTAFAEADATIEAGLNVEAFATVQMAFRVLGGLLDLSSGIKAAPGFHNKFTVDLLDEPITTPFDNWNRTMTPRQQHCDLTLKSDLVFNIDAYATQFWEANLFHLEYPIAELCYDL